MGVKQVARYKFTRVISLLLTRFTIEKASQVAVWPFLNKQLYSFVTPLFTWNHQTLFHINDQDAAFIQYSSGKCDSVLENL